MNLETLMEQAALKNLVNTFSNLADEKKVAEQMPLFTEDANVTTYSADNYLPTCTDGRKLKKYSAIF